jgi:hypothetical protein
MWLWDRIRGVGGNRDDESDEREELGSEDAGEADVRFAEETDYGGQTGLAASDAGQVAQADLDEFKPPRDPAP